MSLGKTGVSEDDKSYTKYKISVDYIKRCIGGAMNWGQHSDLYERMQNTHEEKTNKTSQKYLYIFLKVVDPSSFSLSFSLSVAAARVVLFMHT